MASSSWLDRADNGFVEVHFVRLLWDFQDKPCRIGCTICCRRKLTRSVCGQDFPAFSRPGESSQAMHLVSITGSGKVVVSRLQSTRDCSVSCRNRRWNIADMLTGLAFMPHWYVMHTYQTVEAPPSVTELHEGSKDDDHTDSL